MEVTWEGREIEYAMVRMGERCVSMRAGESGEWHWKAGDCVGRWDF